MKRVIGIGGIFFKCQDRETVKNWYTTHLGIPVEDWGALFPWRRHDRPEEETYTAWSPFKGDTKYFEPSQHEYMVNYQVENLFDLLEQLRQEGVQVLDKTEVSEFGKFGWIIDPEGRKIELWEPPGL
ncbi:MAG: VOC family protein [Bacteroidetes bacterium]|nr:VOC family protein [Bacteroidota bacterium]